MLPGMSPGQRSSLFQEVNDRIYDLLASADPDLPGEFLCECGHDCNQRVGLLPAEFAALRESDKLVRSPDCRRLRFRRGSEAPAAGGVPALG
jgi:hypothetical protein